MNAHQDHPLVSVIVPTMASRERGQLLMRAIASIRASSRSSIQIIAVVNGNRMDTEVCDWLKAQSDVQFVSIAKPSAPNAIFTGRQLVQTEYFSTLDDDDEYLPDATEYKLAALQFEPQADMLVGNAYQCAAGVNSLRYEDLTNVPAQPLECLMQFNWLLSGNTLYRTASVGSDYFKDSHDYAEWTWLAYRLAMDGKKVAVLDVPVFRYNDTAGSLSKSNIYFQSYIPLFQRMLERSPPRAVVHMIQRKMAAAYHDASTTALQDGQLKEAWHNHWRSLIKRGGLKYLPYTRRLMHINF